MLNIFYKQFLLFWLLFSLFFSGAVFAQVYSISLSTDKYLYSYGEAIQFSGVASLLNNATSTPVSTGNISLSLENASLSPISADVAVPLFSGYFNSTFSAPSSAGTYFIRAKYIDSNGTLWQSAISFRVTSVQIDSIFLRPSRAAYYSGEAVSVVIEPVREYSTGYASLAGVEVYGALRYTNGTVISQFGSCAETGTNRTGSDGTCTVSLSAPSASGTYVLEANDFVGTNTLYVIPFDAVVSIKDGTGTYLQSVFSGSQSARIAVSITQNGALPTSGNFYFSGNISDSSGIVAQSIPQTSISNSTYSGAYSFNTGNFSTGIYTVTIFVTESTAETFSSTTFFEVRTWSLSVDKLSGFTSAYNAFPGATLSFLISGKDSAGAAVLLNSNNTNVSIFNKVGTKLASYSPVWNSTLNASVASFTAPSTVGTYTLSVSASSSNSIQSAERVFKVIDLSASAGSTDSEKQQKDIFGGSEQVYVLVSASDLSGAATILNSEIAEIRDEQGNKLNYTNTTWDADSNVTAEWRVNFSDGKAFFKIDNPKRGGYYTAKIYVNERTAVATARFIIEPYSISATPKGENDESSWGRWQFSTRDKVLFTVYVYAAQHKSGSSRMLFEENFGGGMIGMANGGGSGTYLPGSSASSSATAVVNATVSFEEVANDLIMQSVPLSTLNVSCTKTDSNGKADCSAIPAGGKWDGGWYHVVFRATGSDGITSSIGHSGFEARSFYISGYTYDPSRASGGMGWDDSKWMHKPSDNVSIRAYMFDAGNLGWWGYYAGTDSRGSSAGLSGSIAVEKILYRGSPGEWLWPPVTVSSSTYTTSGTGTVSSGQGNLTITSASSWKTGSYSVILRGTKVSGNDSETDYGEIWFEVRQWDAWANPVNVNATGSDKWRSSFNVRENATLYVNIQNAGEYCYGLCTLSDLAGGAAITVGVKKIEDFSSWPPRELNSTDFSVIPISVSKSSPGLWSGGPLNLSYVLTLVPTSGHWESGYYNVILDINGTETGYAWFNAIAFYASAQFVNADGASIWSSDGTSDLYFNVTSTLTPYYNWYGSAPADLINTTLREVRLTTYSQDNWIPQTYSFAPGSPANDFNVSLTSVAGQSTLQIQKAGVWASGYYNGEIILQDAHNSTSTAWTYFQIKPFEVRAYTSSWELSSSDVLNVSIDIIRDWNDPTPLVGNYTILSIIDTQWNYLGSPLDTPITTFTPTEFYGSTNLLITPSGTWSAGSHNLRISVESNESKAGDAWISFNVVPFAVNIVNEKWSYRAVENVSVNVTVAASSYSSVPSQANVSRVVEKDWSTWPARETELNFSVASPGASGNAVNGTGVLSIIPPSAGWSQSYHNLEITFVDPSGNSPTLRWVYFDVRSYDAWAHPVDLNTGAWWSYGFGKNENATLMLEVYEPPTDQIRTPTEFVNVTKVEYRSSSDWTAPYLEANYSINGTSTHEVNGTGIVIINPPVGGWEEGSYEVRLTISGSEGTAQAYPYFQIIDRTPPGITIHSPSEGQIINDNDVPVLLLATTTKLASCDYMTNSMSWRYYGFSYRQLNHSVTIPGDYLSSNGNNTVTVYCHDDSWNENSREVTVYLNVSSRGAPPRANITYPQNGATNVSLTPNITIMFTKPMGGVTHNLVAQSGGVSIDLHGMFYDNATLLVLVPWYPLANNTAYTLTIGGTDTLGNNLENAPLSVTFTTFDPTAPYLSSSTPASGAADIPARSNITIIFSEPMDVSKFNFGLLNATEGDVFGGRVWNVDSTIFTFSPYVPLSYNAQYSVVMFNLTDTAGNAMPDVRYGFTTSASELLNSGFENGATNWIFTTNSSLASSSRTRLDSLNGKLLDAMLHSGMNLSGQNIYVFDAPGRGPETLPTLSTGAVLGNATDPAKPVNYSERITVNNTGLMQTSFASGKTVVMNSDNTNGYDSTVLEILSSYWLKYDLVFDEPVNVSTLVHQNLTFLGKRYLVAAGSTQNELILAANGSSTVLQLGESTVFAGKVVNLTALQINGSTKIAYFEVSDSNETTVFSAISEGFEDTVNGITISVGSVTAQNASLVLAANSIHLLDGGYYPTDTTDYLVDLLSPQQGVISGISLRHSILYTGINAFNASEERSFLEGLVSLKYLGLQEVPVNNIVVTEYPVFLGDFDGILKQAIKVSFPMNVVTRQNADLNHTNEVYVALTQVTLAGTTYENGTLFYKNSSYVPPFYEPLNLSSTNYASFNLGSGRTVALNTTRDPTPLLSIYEPTNGAYAYYGKWVFTFTEADSVSGAPKINSLNFTATRPGAPTSMQGGYLAPVAWTLQNQAFVFKSGYTSPYGTTVSPASNLAQVALSLPIEERLAQLGIGAPGNFLSVRSHSDRGIILNQSVSLSNVSSRWYNFSVFIRRDLSSPGLDGHAFNFYLGYTDNASVFRNYSLFTPSAPNVTVYDSFVKFQRSFQMPAYAEAITSFFVEKVGSGLFWIDNLSFNTDPGDTSPPHIVSSLPLPDAMAVPVVAAPITIVFNEPVNAAQVSFALYDGLVAISVGEPTWNSDNTSFTYNVPVYALSTNTRHTVYVQDVYDLAGNRMADAAYNFTTLPDDELLIEGGFEYLLNGNASTPAYWTISQNNLSLTTGLTQVSALHNNSGSNSLFIHEDRGMVVRQELTEGGVGGAYFNLTAHIAKLNGPSGNSLAFNVTYSNDTELGLTISLMLPPNDAFSGSFSEYSARVQMPADATDFTWFSISKLDAGEFYVDDISLRRVS